MNKTIEERIAELSPYFLGMNVEQAEDNGKIETAIYVSVHIPDKWVIPPDLLNKYGVQFMENQENSLSNSGKYFFFSDLETGFDKILDSIEYTIRENKIAEEKSKIFKEKIEELKKIFEDETYTVKDLRALEFMVKKDEITPPNFLGENKSSKSKKETKEDKK